MERVEVSRTKGTNYIKSDITHMSKEKDWK